MGKEGSTGAVGKTGTAIDEIVGNGIEGFKGLITGNVGIFSGIVETNGLISDRAGGVISGNPVRFGIIVDNDGRSGAVSDGIEGFRGIPVGSSVGRLEGRAMLGGLILGSILLGSAVGSPVGRPEGRTILGGLMLSRGVSILLMLGGLRPRMLGEIRGGDGMRAVGRPGIFGAIDGDGISAVGNCGKSPAGGDGTATDGALADDRVGAASEGAGNDARDEAATDGAEGTTMVTDGRTVIDGGVSEGTDTVMDADGTATVEATTTGITIDPGNLIDGTATGKPRAAIDTVCAAATIRMPGKRKSAESNLAKWRLVWLIRCTVSSSY